MYEKARAAGDGSANGAADGAGPSASSDDEDVVDAEVVEEDTTTNPR
jgi:hypothetical protein